MKKKFLLFSLVITLCLMLTVGLNVNALETVVGETEVYLDAARENIRTGETNMANMITDSFIFVSGADIAITNGGGIREAIEPGEITLEDVLTILPFENEVQTIELTGAEIIATLEHGVGQYPSTWGGFTQVSGIRYTFDSEQPSGERIQEVLYQDEPIDPEATFLVVTNGFLTSGGDEFTMLEKEIIDSFGDMQEVLIAYLEENSPVSPEVEGRVINIRD